MVAEDFKALLPKYASPEEEDDRPLYYLWTFDPDAAEVHLENNDGRDPANYVTHEDMAEHVHHPEKVEGYAYSIKDGWRITNSDHSQVQDPFVVRKVLQKLRGEHPEPLLPSIRYHRL